MLIGRRSFGGEAYEALNHLATMSLLQCLIIIINDNDQSIAEKSRYLYSHLQQLRETTRKALIISFLKL